MSTSLVGRAATSGAVTVRPPRRAVGWPRPWRLSIRGLWLLMTVAATFIGPASSPINLPDIYWTLQSGAWMAEHHQLLETDPFTSAPHVAGPILNVQWLADLVFHTFEALGGLQLVIAGTAAVVALTYALLLAASLSASGHVRLSCLTVWAAYVLGASNLSPRPQTLAYPIFGLFLLAVVRAEWHADRRLLWLLPPATVVWANIHGSFFTGDLLLGCAALAPLLPWPTRAGWRAARPYVLTLAGCIVASLITPYGVGSWFYVASMSANPIVRDLVTEWAPTTVTAHEGILLFGSFALIGGLALRAPLRLRRFEVLVLLAFGLLAWSSVRAVVWWGLAMAPSLARLLGSVLPAYHPRGRDRPWVNTIIAVGVLAVAVVGSPWVKSALPFLPADKRGLIQADAPAGLADYLRRHDPPPAGRMFNYQPWGGYLDWATWPRHHAFLDGRIEVHPTQVWLDYLAITFPSAGWRTLLDQYDISYLVLSVADNADLVADLRQDPAWRLDYADDQAVVFSRSALAASP
jgi:hypothetical protein